MTPPLISVIIPSYRSQNSLGRCLKALAGQTPAVPHEIIVVDSSPDHEIEAICEASRGVLRIPLTGRVSPGMARNAGAGKATGKILLFLDADVFLEPDAFARILDAYEKGRKVFGGALKIAPGSRMLSGTMEHLFFNHESSPRRSPRHRKNLSSALMVIDRKIFLNAGGFKDIPRMQDTELTERLSRTGEKLFFIPSVTGYQLQTATFPQLFRKLFINGNNLFFIRYASNNNLFRKAFFVLGLPLFMLAKITRINYRNMRFQDQPYRWIAALLSPLMYFFGLIWMAGFYKALLKNEGISHER